MATRDTHRKLRKPLSAAAFAEFLLELVRQRTKADVLRSAVRAQLSMPHVTRYEVRLPEDDAYVIGAGASRRLDARRPGTPARLPASTRALVGALEASGPQLVHVEEAPELGAPADATRCCLVRLFEDAELLGVSLSFWDHPASPALDERLLARELMFSGHLGLALRHASIFESMEASTSPESRDASRILSEAEMRGLERRNLLAALEACAGKVAGPGGAAERLGVKPSTLASRVRALGLKRLRWTSPLA